MSYAVQDQAGAVDAAIRQWHSLYPGKLVDYRPLADLPALRAVAVEAPDLRPEPGNWPKIFHHGRRTRHAVVLVHGLTDSPHFMESAGLRFAQHGAGCNVVLPLLPGHGLRRPRRSMRRSDLAQWRRMIDDAMPIAALLGETVSVGGLSTGGALSLDKCLRDPEAVTGKVFLFSAALDLPQLHDFAIRGHAFLALREWLLDALGNHGIGGNPYKYSKMFRSGVRQLSQLTRELAAQGRAGAAAFATVGDHRRVFVAHSEADSVIHVDVVRPWIDPDDPNQHHVAPLALRVDHSELVLDRPIRYDRSPRIGEALPPRANPEFAAMLGKATAFLDR